MAENFDDSGQNTVLKSYLRLPFRVFIVLVLLLGACQQRPERPGTRDRAPLLDVDILLVTVDTLRADHVGCYGEKDIATPVMDRLCGEGVRFEQAVVQSPLTPPSHASILTGTYPPVHQLRDMAGFRLDPDVPTLAGLLREAGFETAAFVAAAVLHRDYGLDRGFDTYRDDMRAPASEGRMPGVVAEIPAHEVTRRAREWLSRRQASGSSRPFLLWVHYYDPHFPYDPPEPYRTRYASDPYAGEVAYTDEQLGELVRFLEEHDLMRRTLIVLLSDHGESLGEHGEQTHGIFLYDSTMRIPLIVAGPGVPQGRAIRQQVRSIDVMPTLLDYLGLPVPHGVQGGSLLPALSGDGAVASHYAYMETFYPRSQMGWSELRALRTDRWKLIEAPRPELYFLDEDPLESRNVFDEHSAEVDRLQKQMWEVAGSPDSWSRPEPQPVDQETLRRLQALGYLGGGGPATRPADLPGADPKDHVHVLQALERVTDLMNRDRFAAALSLLEPVVAEDPTNPMIYSQMGLCLQRLGRWESARQVYLTAVEKGAGSPQTYAELGKIHIRIGDLEGGVSWMEKGLEVNPSDVDNISNLANANLQLGRLEDAERAVRAVLSQRPQHAAAQNIMGLIEIQRGRPLRARRHFEEAIAADPNGAEPYMNLGILAHQAGRRDDALRYFRLFLEKAVDPQYRDLVPRVKATVADLEAELGR